MNYALFSSTSMSFSKTYAFTYMKHTCVCLFFKNHSFYNELYTVRLGAILKPFWHRAGPVVEQSQAEPSRAGAQAAQVSSKPLPGGTAQTDKMLPPTCVTATLLYAYTLTG